MVYFYVNVIQVSENWNEMFWLVSDEGGGGGGGGAGVALSSLEACRLPSRPGRASHLGCYLQVRYQNV